MTRAIYGRPAAARVAWGQLLDMAVAERSDEDDEMVPYWVFQGPAKIERLVPVLPFSREAAALPRLRKTFAAYRLAFGQPRQEELVEFLGENLSDEKLGRLRIDLSPSEQPRILAISEHIVVTFRRFSTTYLAEGEAL